MILRRVLPLAAALALCVAPLLAQGVKIAGEPAGKAGGAKADEAKKDEAKPKKKAAPEKGAKGKKKAAAESKYKSRALVDGTESSYRFDADGNAIGGAKKKSSEKPAKKKSSDDAGEKAREKCSSEEPCADKGASPDADAL